MRMKSSGVMDSVLKISDSKLMEFSSNRLADALNLAAHLRIRCPWFKFCLTGLSGKNVKELSTDEVPLEFLKSSQIRF